MLKEIQISVVVSAYNAEKTIIEALSSIPLRDVRIEAIVVNDGSTDGTLDKILSFANEYPHFNLFVINTVNLGSASARNTGLLAASGKWIAFLDSDDKFNASTLTSFLSEFASLGTIDALRYSYSTASGELHTGHFGGANKDLLREKGYWRFIFRKDFLTQNLISFSPSFEQAKGFYVLDDWYFLLMFCSSKPKVLGHNEVLYYYNDFQRSESDEISRYASQVERESHALAVFAESEFFRTSNNRGFVLERLYERYRMIAILLKPSISFNGKTRLLSVFLMLIVRTRKCEASYYLPRLAKLFLQVILVHFARHCASIAKSLKVEIQGKSLE